MTEDLMRYDVLTQEALRSVIRKVLDEVATAGLPGDHHFFISFETNYPGVRLSNRMRERYPETMTIVIQHSFWDLSTTDTYFEIDLSFNEIRERLKVPFAAVQSFFDPSVKFGLQFEVPEDETADETAEESEDNNFDDQENVSKLPTAKTTSKARKAKKEKQLSDIEESLDDMSVDDNQANSDGDAQKAAKDTSAKSASKKQKSKKSNSKEDKNSDEPKEQTSGDVVSLDAFRKK
ncbi:MAG: SspB family protein [Nitratireductor sp.]